VAVSGFCWYCQRRLHAGRGCKLAHPDGEVVVHGSCYGRAFREAKKAAGDGPEAFPVLTDDGRVMPKPRAE
jgi:hypothetical protein